jgi:hypothetical protein
LRENLEDIPRSTGIQFLGASLGEKIQPAIPEEGILLVSISKTNTGKAEAWWICPASAVPQRDPGYRRFNYCRNLQIGHALRIACATYRIKHLTTGARLVAGVRRKRNWDVGISNNIQRLVYQVISDSIDEQVIQPSWEI